MHGSPARRRRATQHPRGRPTENTIRFSFLLLITWPYLPWCSAPAGETGEAPLAADRRAAYAKFARYGVAQGLAQNTVYAVVQDPRGFLWMGTQDGLSRFDGLQFRTFRPDGTKPGSLSGPTVTRLYLDSSGRLWVGTQGDGLNLYDPATHSFQHFRNRADAADSLSSDIVQVIFEDTHQTLWVGTENGLNARKPDGSGWTAYAPGPGGLPHHSVNALAEDAQGRLWIGTGAGLAVLSPDRTALVHHRRGAHGDTTLPDSHITTLAVDGARLYVGTTAGLNLFDLNTLRFKPGPLGQTQTLAPSIDAMLRDSRGRLWLGTARGLLRYDPKEAVLAEFHHRADDPLSLSSNVVTALCEDASGIFWVGTEAGGVNKLNPYSEKMLHVQPGRGQDGLPDPQVTAFHADRKGRFWVTSDGGGIVQFDPETGRFSAHYMVDADDPARGPSDNHLWSMSEDGDGRLWITSRNGLNRFDPDTGAWRHYRHNPRDADSLSLNKCFSACFDPEGRLWVATFGSGIDVLEDPEGRFRHYRFTPNQEGSIAGGLTLYVGRDGDDRMWVGTYGSGLSLYHPETDTFQTFQHRADAPDSLADDTVGFMLTDSAGRVWFATGGGLSRYHPDTGRFSNYTHQDGLADNNTYALAEDDAGHIWVSTNSGLSRLDPATGVFTNWDTSHNLQSNEFNQLAAYRRNGLLYFGGVNGFNMFDPAELAPHAHAPPVVLTAFKKFNEPVDLIPAIESRDTLVLAHDDQVVSFEFAGLDYLAPERNVYAYILEGFNKAEIQLGNKHDLTFTNLDPGRYVLRIRAANGDGVWNPDVRSLHIEVRPPFRQTLPAYLLYALAGLALLGAAWRYQQQRLERAQTVNRRLRDLDHLKDAFLADTSAELRTPLNGMIGIAATLLEGAGGTLTPTMRENLEIMVANGRRLNGLINDLLDFSKTKHHSLSLQLSAVDIYAVTRVATAPFEPICEEKGLRLTVAVPRDLPLVRADENRLQQIIHNLLDNAVKYTSVGGIRINAQLRGKEVAVHITDSGIGMAPEQQAALLESLTGEDPEAGRGPGSGLGLALTRRLVALHGGTVTLTSTPGAGTTFSFTVPVDKDQPNTAEVPVLEEEGHTGENEGPDEAGYDETRFQILVVDDEAATRTILFNLLKVAGYHVTACADGGEALRRLEGTRRYDLVLLDVMMPRITGYEVCRKLREQFSLQELPVLFMVAAGHAHDQQMGFRAGANDFISKPISKDELLSRVRMHLSLLDVHRNLETMVAQRTFELEGQNKELQTLDVIVQAINREMHMDHLLQTVLAESLRLFSQADSGSFLLLDPKRGYYRVAASSGYPEELARRVRMTPAQVAARYKEGTEEVESGIFIVRDPREHTRPEPVRSVPAPKALLAMEVQVEEKPVGVLVLDHSTSNQGFTRTDVRRLLRLREHIVSAISRARLLENLEAGQRDLVEAAHLFGMADNASLVLHNMGNKLNSVNTSVQILRERMVRAQWAHLVARLQDLAAKPEEWARLTQTGDRFPEMVARVLMRIDAWKEDLGGELGRLEQQVNDVVLALRAQWDYTGIQGVVEDADPVRLLQACAHQDRKLGRMGITVEEAFETVPMLAVQKVKLMRVIFCLLENAVDAVLAAKPVGGGRVLLRAYTRDDTAYLTITDNGTGIAPENLERLFVQGFSTKAGSSTGFGLHNCANALAEMHGKLSLHNAGSGWGATAVIALPLHRDTEADGPGANR